MMIDKDGLFSKWSTIVLDDALFFTPPGIERDKAAENKNPSGQLKVRAASRGLKIIAPYQENDSASTAAIRLSPPG
jgi:hypothetical protein